MNAHLSSPERLPTLTEVVHWPGAALDAAVTTTVPVSASVPVLGSGHLSESTESRPADLPNSVAPLATAIEAAPPSVPLSVPPSASVSMLADELLTQQVYADLQRQVELVLEYRLRETLVPLLTRATDSIVRDARNELASTLRDVVARAVAQELSRHRTR